MEVHGNKTWNNATDNKDKTLVPMAEDTFRKIQQRLDNSGINYFSYSKDSKTVMAINDKDIDWLKSLIGKDANRMEIRKSDVAYTPPQKNIIGNAEYRYIPQKEYISLDSDTALKMAELMEKQNIQFSGRVSAHGKTTLTVSHSDLEKVKGIQGNVIAMRRQFAKDEKADEIIGNKAYRDINERHYFHSKMKPEEYKEIQPFLETSAEYSGLIRDGKVIFTVEQNEASQFYMALESAHREAEIYSDLAESGLGEEHISQMKDIIHQAAVEDIHISLDNFFDERYSDEQFSEMIKLTEKYIAQSPAERMGKETVLEDMLKAKHNFDRNIEMDEYFSEHSYSDEQKALITDMFMNNESRTLIDAIDESFTPFDIQQYSRIIHNYNEPGDVTDFLNNHRMLASLPFADRYADEIEEMNSFLSSNERIIETAAKGDYNEYLYAFNEEFVNHVLLSDNKNFSDSFFTNFNELNIDFTNSIFGELKEKIFDETERHHEKSEPVRSDSISFSYGKDKEWFTESSILADFAEKNPEISFALANAVFEYLDEKQHTERNIPELNAGWYKKTDFVISGVIGGENFNYEGRFDIGDGKGTGGGSLIDHIRDINQGILDSERYPYNTPDSKEKAQNTLDILIPFLETHSQLTAEEMKILSDFKAENPVRTEPELEPQQEFKIYQMKSGEEYHYNRFESLENNKGKINIDDYEVVYSGFMDEYTGNTLAEKLESIYAEFNTHLPDNYFGHSLSMSDVIVTDDKAFYVDTIGFAEFPEFFKEKEIVLSNDEHEKSEPAVNIPEQKREPVDRGPVTMRKVGDFYEMYGKNAEIGMEVLGLHNTPKNGSPMVGFPDHVKDEYSAKLGEAGYTVLIEQAFELNPPKREIQQLTTLQDVVDKYFGSDCESAETDNGTWKITIADNEKAGEVFHNGEPVCGIYNRGDRMEVEPYDKLSSIPKMVADAMLKHNPDKPVDIAEFKREFETPLDKAKYLINSFCEAEYDSEADFSDLHNVGIAYTTLTDDELPVQVTADLIDFKITYEFNGEVYNTEQYDSIDDMIKDGLTGLDFDSIISVPDEVIDRHTGEIEDRNDVYHSASKAAEETEHNKPERTADDITVGDKYLLKSAFDEKEVTVTSMKGIYPDDVGITEYHKSGDMEYETTSNIDKFKLNRDGEYLGNVNDIQYEHEKNLAEEKTPESVKMTVFHGTTRNFDTFRPDYRGAIWTETDFDIAKKYAGNVPESNVLTCEAELKNPAHFTFGSAENWDIDQTIREAMSKGHDSAIIDFKFAAGENHFYQYMLNNQPDTLASEFFNNIMGVSSADALEGETIGEFAKRMAENDNIIHSYVAVFNPDQVQIIDRTSVYEKEETELDKAKNYINNFCIDEYSAEADFSDLSKISIAYTTDEETDLEIQVSADLEKYRLIYEYDGNVVRDEQYNSLSEMNENALSVLDYDDLVSFSEDEKTVAKTDRTSDERTNEKTTNDIEEDVPLFADADVIEEIQKSERAEENKPFHNTYGEQMSLFGFEEPVQKNIKPERKSEPKAKQPSQLFVGGINTMSALHDEILRGSGFHGGKLRIQKFYDENTPSTKEFADFLNKEYGVGGHSADDPIAFVDHDSKGIQFTLTDENGRFSDEKFSFKWTEVASMTAELIDKGEYLNDMEREKYSAVSAPEIISEELFSQSDISEEIPAMVTSEAESEMQTQQINDIAEEPVVESEQPEPDKGENFTIKDTSLGEGGVKTKFKANIAAIETLKMLEKENRPATDEEKETLSKYVGWGGIPQAFDNDNDSWAAEYTQLKELLTPQEYRQANASVLDAFYTSPTVIDGIYEALENFGFEGGNVLEPAMGVGNFFGRMPEEMQKNSQLYGVEIDSISGRIAQKLYPDADIAIQGFEKNNYQNGCFDVAVGNVPFGELGFKDDKHGTNKLHDYFFAETLDKVKDGGIVAFVTSAGTLDKRDETTRQMLADKADFIGAIRLPGGKNGAFKDNAGTEVTTDIIFLQKHNDKTVREMLDVPDWVCIGETADGLPINKYFEQNPDMVLGTVVEGNKLYGSGTMVVADDGFDLQTALHDAVSKLSAQINMDKARDVYAKSEDGIDVKIPSNLRNYSFFEQDNQIFFKKKENVCDKVYDSDNSQFKRAKAFIELRDITRDLLEAQELDKPDSEIKALQDKLNSVYDDFYKKYGLLHSQSNKRYFSDDVSYNLVAGLEKKFDKNILEEKSDIFTKRTIQPPKAVEHVETALEALTLSVAETAGVDFEYMGKLTSMTEDELKKDLAGEIYKVPHTENSYQTASEYLSGDIRQKLKIAEEVAEYDSDFNINVNALKKAMPEPLKAGDIDVKIGAAWLEPKYYEQFMYETFQTPRDNRADCPTHSFWRKPKNITAEYSEHTGTWHIENKNADRSVITTQQFGSKKMNAYDIMEHLLNLKDPKIYKTIEVPDGMGDTKEKRVVDIDATRVVQKKADKIKSEFKKWIFKDQERRETIVEKYNELFNSVRPREYDGSNLSFPMMNSDIKLHDHQKNAIAHAMFGGNTLFAHSVGAGKTFEMIATAMESKRLGLCTKSMFAVPNHLTEQIGDDFQKLYPSANVLVATKKDFQKENRQQLFAKIATGNFDAVIIGHSQLGMIPISKERQENMLQSQISDIVEGIKELKKQEGSKFQIKTMERTKKSLEKNLDKLQKNHDDTITFEQLGVDKLFVDEAHEFKNLFTPTKLNNISGISNSASQKALDLFMKCQYLDEKTDGKGVVFATGTPLSNSVTELHTMMRYLEYDFLKEHGLANFDNWVTVFGEQKTDWELAPAGNKFKERTRIANYTGLPELMSMFKQIADIRTADSLKLDVPDCEYKIVNVEATPFQKELVDELADRADAINAGNVDPSIDNMLKITSDGRKLGLDPRLIDPSFEDNPDTKLNKCVENVARIHGETTEDKLTQIIFCDLGVPHKNNTSAAEKDGEDDSKSSAERDSLEEECDFCVYDDIKQKLIDKGIPESEIAYIHNAKTEKQKSELFDKVRSGEVRVLLGSTAKMGTGTNVQKKLIAVHDLDIPWRPADLEQRAGRIIRQGNENKNVQIYRYVTKGTFDAYSYQTLENKQKFISQIMTSKTPARKCEDVDQQALSYSEIKALCTGDERIKEKLMLDNEVKELKVLSSEHQNTVYEMQDKIKAFPEKEQRLTNSLDNLRTDREHLRTLPIDTETKLPVFKITIGETEYKDKKEAAKAFEDAVLSISKADTPVKVGEFQGFPLSVTVHSPYMGGGISATMNGAYPHTTKLIESFAHNLRRLEGCLYNIDRKIDDVNNNLAKLRVDHTEAQKIVSEPFPQADELAEKEERLKTLTDELNQAAIEAKKNAPKKEKTCYFERAKLKKEAMRISRQKPKQAKDRENVKKQPGIE